MSHARPIAIDRDLTDSERGLVRWMLEHGSGDNSRFLAQLESARVASLCGCGCASIDFSVAGALPTSFEMTVLADYRWETPEHNLCGAFVFAQDGLLAGLDLWSIDGNETPESLPEIRDLVPL